MAYLLELGGKFGHECAWPPDSRESASQFFTENGTFGFGCAATTHCVIRDRKPKHIIEIGSGMSSLVISSALRENMDHDAAEAMYTIIDPYPSPKLDQVRGIKPSVIPTRVEDIAAGMFDELESGDILFVDSGHVVRIGGDVNFLILDVLPRLNQGVVVHFHDIPLPYEYPKIYLTDPAFRMLWTEAYLLQAFLAHNHEYEVLLGMAFLMTEHLDAFCNAFPFFNPVRHVARSGSFWIARR